MKKLFTPSGILGVSLGLILGLTILVGIVFAILRVSAYRPNVLTAPATPRILSDKGKR